MFAVKYALAGALLSAPPDSVALSDARGDPAAWHGFLAGAVRHLAVERELFDPREITILLHDPRQFAADLKELQRRQLEFADAPKVEECRRFPQRSQIQEWLTHNRSYRNDLAARLALDTLHAEELQAAIWETDQLHRIWDTLCDARRDYYYVTVRREALKQVRELVGLQAFYSGQLPPYVPLWRFPKN